MPWLTSLALPLVVGTSAWRRRGRPGAPSIRLGYLVRHFREPVPVRAVRRRKVSARGNAPCIEADGWREPRDGETCVVPAPSGATAAVRGSAWPQPRCRARSGLRPSGRRGPGAPPQAGVSRPFGAESTPIHRLYRWLLTSAASGARPFSAAGTRGREGAPNQHLDLTCVRGSRYIGSKAGFARRPEVGGQKSEVSREPPGCPTDV